MYFNDPTLYGATLPFEKEFPLRSSFVGNTPFMGFPWQNYNKFTPQAFTPWMGYNVPQFNTPPWMGFNTPQFPTPWMGFGAPQFNTPVNYPFFHQGAFNPFVETGFNRPLHNYNLPIQHRPFPY